LLTGHIAKQFAAARTSDTLFIDILLTAASRETRLSEWSRAFVQEAAEDVVCIEPLHDIAEILRALLGRLNESTKIGSAPLRQAGTHLKSCPL